MNLRVKPQHVFCKLQLHVLRQENLKIWLNPGLNVTISRRTGPRAFSWERGWCYIKCLSSYSNHYRIPLLRVYLLYPLSIYIEFVGLNAIILA